MDKDDVMHVLRGLCAQIMSVPGGKVVPEARLVADLGADSLDITELEAAIEDAFGVTPGRDHTRRVATVEDVAELVLQLRAAADTDEVGV